ncbi:MAG: xylulokinase [Candidatus Lokiarchaeota archaeon]|nr:xylulokinase [Candidatus Lokiarchaeota archaeon]
MTNDYIAVIDAGTTGLRTMIFDLKGKEIARDYKEYKSNFPKSSWVEQDAMDWWDAVKETSKNVFKTSKINPASILGICVTNQRETIVPVDEKGTPLRKALVWQDRRSITECNWIRNEIGEEKIYDITGLTIDPYFSATKMLWIKNHQPELFEKIYKFLLVHDFIEMKLTDEFVTDWSNASRTMLFDIRKNVWSEELCDQMGISIDILPRALPSARNIGQVSPDAAYETGFVKGTPIITGGGDQQCAAVGLGVIKSGRVKVTTGTGSFVLNFTDNIMKDPERRVLLSAHAVPGKYVLEASIFTTGSVFRWFRDSYGIKAKERAKETGRDPYELLIEEAEKAPLGAEGVIFIPHFMGAGAPYWNPYARGVIAGLTLASDRSNVLRALLESVGFEIKKNLEVFKSLGIDLKEIRITGGGTRSTFWNQIQADIFGIPVMKGMTEESTALGCAVLGAIGLGIYKNFDVAEKNMIEIREPRSPNLENTKKYDKIYELNKKICDLFLKYKIDEEISRIT